MRRNGSDTLSMNRRHPALAIYSPPTFSASTAEYPRLTRHGFGPQCPGIFASSIKATMVVFSYCTTFLRKPRDFPFPFSVRLSATLCSMSSPERMRSRAARVWNDQETAPERSQSNPAVIQEHTLTTQTQTVAPNME